MNQLDLIWKLEVSNKLLKEYNENLESKNNKISKSKANTTINKLREDLEGRDDYIKVYKDSIRAGERVLKEYDYNLKTLEETLYKGDIQDIKQLEHLTKERNDIQNLVDELELKLLVELEELDKKEKEKEEILKEIQEIEKDKEGILGVLKDEVDEILSDIDKQEKILEEISKGVEENILDKYESIKNTKTIGVVKVVDGVCKGCNMHISSMTWSNVKNGNEISCCDNCGRILYYQE